MKIHSGKEAGDAGPRRTANHLRLRHLVLLLGLLIAPGLALHKLAAFVDYRWLLGYGIVISLVTYALYGADKDSVQDKASRWRASENLLHGLEFCGGWPGAFLAQRQFRHKCSKVSYQLVFWLIVSIHVYAATDYQLNWRIAHSLERLILPGV